MNTTSKPRGDAVAAVVEDQLELTLDELGRACHCSRTWIVRLVDEGVLQPSAGHAAADWRFDSPALARAHRAARLARDLKVNLAGVALALELLDRIEALERQRMPPRAGTT
jgi:chaperone modulatory protein CbpM